MKTKAKPKAVPQSKNKALAKGIALTALAIIVSNTILVLPLLVTISFLSAFLFFRFWYVIRIISVLIGVYVFYKTVEKDESLAFFTTCLAYVEYFLIGLLLFNNFRLVPSLSSLPAAVIDIAILSGLIFVNLKLLKLIAIKQRNLSGVAILLVLVLVTIPTYKWNINKLQRTSNNERLASQLSTLNTFEFKFFKPTFAKNDHPKIEVDALSKSLGFGPDYLTIDYSEGQLPHYMISEFKVPKYYQPPANCGANIPSDSEVTEACHEAGESKAGCMVYTLNSDASTSTSSFCQIAGTLVVLDYQDFGSDSLNGQQVIGIFDSLKLATPLEIQQLNTN